MDALPGVSHEKREAVSHLSAEPWRFTGFWQRYQRPLQYFVAALLGTRCATDPACAPADVVQEIMIKIYRSRHRFDAGRSESAWVYSIARNHCRDLLRRNRTGRRHINRNIDVVTGAVQAGTGPTAAGCRSTTHVPVARTSEEPDQQLLAAELRRTVRAFMESLKPDDRAMLFLRFYEEMPYSRIAHTVGRPEGTVRYRIHEIKKRLKAYVEAEQ